MSEPLHLFAQHLLVLLVLAGGACLLAVLAQLPSWLLARISGPARDWPLVADRVARALERREPLDEVLSSLWLQVGLATRARLDEALAVEEPSPGRRLVAAGLVPAAQAPAIAAAPTADLPALLRLSARERDDDGVRRLRGHAVAILLVLGLFCAWQLTWSGPVMRLGKAMAQQAPGMDLGLQLIVWSQYLAIGLCAAAALLAVLWACGHRLGWWERLAGWDALARALMLRRMLAAGVRESACAEALAAAWPRLRRRLASAGARGDLPGLLAAAGWRASSPAALERAIGSDLERRRRRTARFVLLAALFLPVGIAVPIGLAGSGIMLAVVTVQAPLNGIAGQAHTGMAGSFSMVFLYRLLPGWRLLP